MRDGLRLSAQLHPSAAAKTRGAVVFVHGFCGNKDENGLFLALAAQCAATGFDSVLYDWRGIAQSDGSFASTTLVDHVADFEQVIEWTGLNLQSGAEALHAVGFSLGAAVVGLALRRQVTLAAAAYLSPAVRPRLSMWPRYNSRRIRRELARRGVVEKPGGSVLLGRPILESLRDIDLGERAFDLDVPLLVCHGTHDTRIDCSHTQKLVAQRSGTQAFRYIEFEGASHSFRPEAQCWARLATAITGWFTATPSADQALTAYDDEREYSLA